MIEDNSYKYFKYVKNEYQTEYFYLNSYIDFTDYAAYFFYNNNTHMNFTYYATMENCKNAINPIENIFKLTVLLLMKSETPIFSFIPIMIKDICFPEYGIWLNFTIVKNTIQCGEYSDSSCLDLVSNFTNDLDILQFESSDMKSATTIVWNSDSSQINVDMITLKTDLFRTKANCDIRFNVKLSTDDSSNDDTKINENIYGI
ncbi:hypothetical protein ENUP19_0021G0035 [Entamoeba nuttalli]|uniref:Tyrosine kinase n=1 Tax=Entamoeba nuttalli TaxID=412467 RepID=A0ABQ0D938_9EUKA